jgi:integrase/recombinase XerD
MSVLGHALEDYLRLRRALGFKLERHGRLLPLHQSTTDALGAYADLRDELCPRPGTPAFFVSTAGTRLAYSNVYATFRHLVRTAGLEPRAERCHPRLHDFRH